MEWTKRIDKLIASVEERLGEWSNENSPNAPRILIDRAEREPYMGFQESKGPLNQIRIRGVKGDAVDIKDHSPVIAAIEKFELFRAYVDRSDTEAYDVVDMFLSEVLEGREHA